MKFLRTKTAVIILLVLYGVVLAVVSYKVFSRQETVAVPKVVQPIVNTVKGQSDSAGLQLRSDGQIILTTNGNKISVVQLSVALPYSESLKTTQGSFVLPGFNPFYHKTVVDKTNNQIIINMAGYTLTGFSSDVPVVAATITLNGKPITQTQLRFNRIETKVMALGNDLPLAINYTE